MAAAAMAAAAMAANARAANDDAYRRRGTRVVVFCRPSSLISRGQNADGSSACRQKSHARRRQLLRGEGGVNASEPNKQKISTASEQKQIETTTTKKQNCRLQTFATFAVISACKNKEEKLHTSANGGCGGGGGAQKRVAAAAAAAAGADDSIASSSSPTSTSSAASPPKKQRLVFTADQRRVLQQVSVYFLLSRAACRVKSLFLSAFRRFSLSSTRHLELASNSARVYSKFPDRHTHKRKFCFVRKIFSFLFVCVNCEKPRLLVA